jgi:putative PIN family toxin of toxin-antitoxin system
MLLKEYYEVLARPKFTRYPDFTAKANALLADIASKALNFTPQETLSVIADDADNRLLELADEAQADYIITGNTNHFNFPQFHDTKIITPKDYWLLGANPEGSKI